MYVLSVYEWKRRQHFVCHLHIQVRLTASESNTTGWAFFFSIKWSPDTAQDNDIKTLKTRQIIKLLLKMALKFDIKFAERLYLSNVSGNGVVSSSAVYSEATLILSSCCEGRAQQIAASDVIAMEKVRVPKL